MSRHLRYASLCLLATMLWSPSTVAAQPAPSDSELAEARSNFQEGLRLSNEQQWKEAASKFRQVLFVQPSAAVQYNLAFALSRAGELDEVAWHVDAVTGTKETPASVRAKARELETHMNTTFAQLVFDRTKLGDDALLLLNGRRLRLRGDSARVYVMPGTHNVVLKRGGKTAATTRATVAKGTVNHVAFAELTDLGTPDTKAQVVSVDAPAKRRLAKDWRLWVGLGVALAAGVGVGVAIGRSNRTSTTRVSPDPFDGSFTPGAL